MSGGLHFDFSTPMQSGPTIPSISTSSIEQSSDDQFTPTDIEAESRLENCEVNFKFNDEGYTLVNILKQYLEKMPEVQFVGRRKHHKLDDHINLRIKLDRKWVEQNHQTVELAMIDCLRRAARQAIEDTVSLRNSIPDVAVRTVNFDEQSTAQSLPPQFQTLFDPSEFNF